MEHVRHQCGAGGHLRPVGGARPAEVRPLPERREQHHWQREHAPAGHYRASVPPHHPPLQTSANHTAAVPLVPGSVGGLARHVLGAGVCRDDPVLDGHPVHPHDRPRGHFVRGDVAGAGGPANSEYVPQRTGLDVHALRHHQQLELAEVCAAVRGVADLQANICPLLRVLGMGSVGSHDRRRQREHDGDPRADGQRGRAAGGDEKNDDHQHAPRGFSGSGC
mmetsp:Transcript_110125/g.350882  ORF Transcript_110125/g.350882 Transcript_110125/m.350882 type:complete len:221 (+) Transcript_110125:696-1358(+)